MCIEMVLLPTVSDQPHEIQLRFSQNEEVEHGVRCAVIRLRGGDVKVLLYADIYAAGREWDCFVRNVELFLQQETHPDEAFTCSEPHFQHGQFYVIIARKLTHVVSTSVEVLARVL